ncbi:MAG: hypothetical protein COB04_02165 [Gammaproteobacteria bacterium]|nr:MAG: hypothetical protein COB04_02165 [Gammaproteobacteria bacterium]
MDNLETSQEPTEATTNPENTSSSKRFQKTRIALFTLGGLICSVFSGIWVYQHQTHIYSSDARISAEMITISSEVSGRVTEVLVGTGHQLVAQDIILKVDDSQAQALKAEIEARLATIIAKKNTLHAERLMLRAQLKARRNNQLSALTAAEAAVNAARSNLSLAQQDYKRAQLRADKKMISRQAFEKAHAVQLTSNEAFTQSTAQVSMAHAALAEVEADTQQFAVLASELVELDAQANEVKAQLAHQAVDIEYRILRSVQKAIVDDVFVAPGERVSKGQRLALIHDPEDLWIKTNIKETAIRHLQVGASVEISIDAYPGETFTGSVTGIGHSATSAFALIPSPNPSGNFTKITQRIPVRIDLDRQGYALRPGMMVEVKIER